MGKERRVGGDDRDDGARAPVEEFSVRKLAADGDAEDGQLVAAPKFDWTKVPTV